MILLIVLAVLAALAAVPLKLALDYHRGTFQAAVRVGPVTVFRYPAKKEKTKKKDPAKEKSPEKAAKKSEKTAASAQDNGPGKEESAPAETGSAGKPAAETGPAEQLAPAAQPAPAAGLGERLEKWMPFVRLGWELLGDLRRKLRVDRLRFLLVLADPDPCDLAVKYGRVLAVQGSLMPLLERALEIRRREIDIRCDFAAEKTELTARADVVLTLGRAAALAAVYGVRVLKEYWKNKPKGGA